MPLPPKSADVRHRAVSFAAMALTLGALMIALGWLLVHPLAHTWPFSVEDGVDRTLAEHRDTGLNAVTAALSTIADTPCAVLIAAIAIVCARWVSHRWRDALFIATALAVEVAVFLVTTVIVHRPRPAVLELDHSPPTSSFPSGHAAAAVALYGAIAWLIVRRTGRAYAWCLLLMPIAVGFARLYRGMHHPSDVAAGILLGACALLVAAHAVLDSESSRARTVTRTAPARRRTVALPDRR